MSDGIRLTLFGFFALFAIVGGLYMGLWVCMVGGIVAVITGAQTDPINATQIGIGVVRFFSAGFVGWATFAVGFICAKMALGE